MAPRPPPRHVSNQAMAQSADRVTPTTAPDEGGGASSRTRSPSRESSVTTAPSVPTATMGFGRPGVPHMVVAGTEGTVVGDVGGGPPPPGPEPDAQEARTGPPAPGAPGAPPATHAAPTKPKAASTASALVTRRRPADTPTTPPHMALSSARSRIP